MSTLVEHSAARAPRQELEDGLAAARVLRQRLGDTDCTELAAALYEQWYARPLVPGVTHEERCRLMPPELTRMLRTAHAANAEWVDGFTVVHAGGDGRVLAQRGEEQRLLERLDYLVRTRPGTVPAPGDEVSTTARRDRIAPDSPWWYTFSAGWPIEGHPDDLVRFYWHVDLDGLARLVHELTALATHAPSEWMLKVARDPSVHRRADAVVVYLPSDALAWWAPALVEIARSFEHWASSAGPPLTLPVAPGLAAARDPGGSTSFGESRCSLVAEACATGGLEEAAHRHGVDPGHPWRRTDQGALPWES